ncbi:MULTISPECIES: O-succinylhomoserine sulfhydrylase [unclassified Pseudactinotalea]|uniref:O-succinylhomoserine sulfhydrylase n=1 Tax=unclassified Pseudactinotalea TaxID=2649176 RepID=UPI00128E3F2E|nr:MULTISPECIES: O-succinylhomoserine sulfhydrylase [unclassified Pseudactinotalea]MPV49001.1 O-succinylhomoserine sulfhydrylase [Pseudactinotalea sp. HY160]QGH68323.1 O-succinylhomoserine sulfhydrylase [Pseudactinotalea sp. HY158]
MSEPRPRCSLPGGLDPATYAARGGLERTGFAEMSEPIFLTQGFVYDRAADAAAAFAGDLPRYIYSRDANPTVAAFEERLRLIEGAGACTATASGMSAIHACLNALLRPGSRVVAAQELFGTTFAMLEGLFADWGVRTDYVTGADLDEWRTALAEPADVVILETPSNPMNTIVDLPAVAELAHAAGATVVVDNVMATPILQRPLELGADVVVYSTTKHIDGQGRVIGGAILGTADFINGPVEDFIHTTGPTLSAFNGWVLLKGLETLPLRVRAMADAALELAEWLEGRPGVRAVHYPFLPSHPQHDLARRLMSGGGTVVTFDLGIDDDDPAVATERTFAFMDALQVIDISNNLGDVKSIVTHPSTTTHRKLGPEVRAANGIGATTIRFSVGLEAPADLIADLDQALTAAGLQD